MNPGKKQKVEEKKSLKNPKEMGKKLTNKSLKRKKILLNRQKLRIKKRNENLIKLG